MSNEYGHIKTHANELVKQYIVYDGSSRMEYVYEARANTLDGEPCMKTQYAYDGGSTRIVKMLETVAEWDSAYDI